MKFQNFKTVDPEKQRLADDLRISMAKEQQTEFMLVKKYTYTGRPRI
jgi:hypothetical protein